MIEFEWPWMLVLLPLPWLIRQALPGSGAAGQTALRVPDLDSFAGADAGSLSVRHQRWPLWLAMLAWALLLVAAARPQWIGEPVGLPASGRDLVLAVDLSESMTEQDFRLRGNWVTRLAATKAVAGEFIARRTGDRVGLILFGEQAYLQAPLTFDRPTVATLLNEAQIGLAGRTTAIGDAIGLAVKRLRDDESANKRVLVLLTDGANTAGEVDPLEAARLAAREGLTIYTVGMGADEMVVRGLLGSRRVNPSSGLDEETLRNIALTTGGRYFRARDTGELENIYQVLDQLEPVESDTLTYRPTRALFFWPLTGALILAALLLVRTMIPARLRYAR